MGHIKVETLGDNRGIHEYEVFNFTETEIIEYMILHRNEIDEFYYPIKNQEYHPFASNGVYVFHELITDLYIDLDSLIKNSKLNDKQLYILNKLMMGYTFQDISYKTGWGIAGIKGAFKKACRQIKERNDMEYDQWLEINGYVKIHKNITYKTCSKCGDQLRANEDNFRKHPLTKDGFQSRCRKCERT